MVTIRQAQQGLVRFIDQDVVSRLSGWEKIVIGGGGGLIAARLPQVLEKYLEHPVVSALGVYDKESGELDLDAVYEAVKPYIGDEPINVKIPLVGITLKLSRREIDNLYDYIREA